MDIKPPKCYHCNKPMVPINMSLNNCSYTMYNFKLDELYGHGFIKWKCKTCDNTVKEYISI